VTKNIVLSIAAITALGVTLGCKAKTDEPMARVNPEPSSYAWWLRILFRPAYETIRGIPVDQLDRNWVRATELKKEYIPKELLFERGTDNMKANHLEFSQFGDFNQDGTNDEALVGVYEDRKGGRGEFLLIVTKRLHMAEKIFLKAWPGKGGYLALGRNGKNIQVWDCMECDNFAELAWDQGSHKFDWVPEIDEE
jgi:hypothetical protein